MEAYAAGMRLAGGTVRSAAYEALNFAMSTPALGAPAFATPAAASYGFAAAASAGGVSAPIVIENHTHVHIGDREFREVTRRVEDRLGRNLAVAPISTRQS